MPNFKIKAEDANGKWWDNYECGNNINLKNPQCFVRIEHPISNVTCHI